MKQTQLIWEKPLIGFVTYSLVTNMVHKSQINFHSEQKPSLLLLFGTSACAEPNMTQGWWQQGDSRTGEVEGTKGPRGQCWPPKDPRTALHAGRGARSMKNVPCQATRCCCHGRGLLQAVLLLSATQPAQNGKAAPLYSHINAQFENGSHTTAQSLRAPSSRGGQGNGVNSFKSQKHSDDPVTLRDVKGSKNQHTWHTALGRNWLLPPTFEHKPIGWLHLRYQHTLRSYTPACFKTLFIHIFSAIQMSTFQTHVLSALAIKESKSCFACSMSLPWQCTTFILQLRQYFPISSERRNTHIPVETAV